MKMRMPAGRRVPFATSGLRAVAFFLALAAGATPCLLAQKAPASPAIVRFKAVIVAEPRIRHYGISNRVEFDRSFQLGPHEVLAREEERGVRIDWKGDQSNLRPLIETRKDRTVQVGEWKGRVDVHFFWDLFGRLHHLNPHALSATVLGERLLFFDDNYDGSWFEPGVDSFGVPGSPYSLPWRNPMAWLDQEAEFVDFDRNRMTAGVRVKPIGPGLSPEERLALRSLNGARAAHGLLPCWIHDELSMWCHQHSQWMSKNRMVEHEEKPGTPGASENGNLAGLNSLVGDGRDPGDSFFGLFDTPLHGYELGSPMMTQVALGCVSNYLSVWWTQEHGMEWPDHGSILPAVFPPDRATGIPVSWWDEIPDPREGDPSIAWGYPIRVYLERDCRLTKDHPKDVKASLRPWGERKDVPLQVVSDSATQQPHALSPSVEFLILPREILASKTLYHLHLEWTYQGKAHVWDSTFKTGAQRGQYRSTLEAR